MTPEREAKIRAWLADEPACLYVGQCNSARCQKHSPMRAVARDLLAEIDRLRALLAGEGSIVVRGVVTAIYVNDIEDGCSVRLRVPEADATVLACAGAFGCVLRVTLSTEPEHG